MPTPIDYELGTGLAAKNVCAECGGRLSVAWGGYWNIDGYVLRCGTDSDHQGWKSPPNTRKLFDSEKGWISYDMSTQQPTDEAPQALAVPNTQAAMLARVRESIAAEFLPRDSFSSSLSPAQQLGVAKVALAYGLDPMMGELAILHGKPYITIKAKRRKHAEAKHHPTITFRDLHDWEKNLYRETGALGAKDLAIVGLMTTEYGNTVEHFAKVTLAERERTSTKDPSKYASPIVVENPIEMLQKRAENGCWEKAYGTMGLPRVFEELLLEASESVDGEIISEFQVPWCDTHDIQFKRNISDKDGHVWYSHRQGNAWHNAAPEQNDLFEGITPTGEAHPAVDDGGPAPDDSDQSSGDGDQPPDEGAAQVITSTEVFALATELGYGPARIPTMLGSKEARITLPQWIASKKTYAEAMTRIRKYHQMDKGGPANA